jgi:hypothetical protein
MSKQKPFRIEHEGQHCLWLQLEAEGGRTGVRRGLVRLRSSNLMVHLRKPICTDDLPCQMAFFCTERNKNWSLSSMIRRVYSLVLPTTHRKGIDVQNGNLTHSIITEPVAMAMILISQLGRDSFPWDLPAWGSFAVKLTSGDQDPPSTSLSSDCECFCPERSQRKENTSLPVLVFCSEWVNWG